jgi:hypothetical protein
MPVDDLTEDLLQVARLRAEGRATYAALVLAELRAAFGGHPALARCDEVRARPLGVPQVVADRPTESILTYRPQIARRPLRACSAA